MRRLQSAQPRLPLRGNRNRTGTDQPRHNKNMDTLEDCLEALGLHPGASWDDITTAYRDLMRVWHPDRFPNDQRLKRRAEQESQKINAAMEQLRRSFKQGIPLPRRKPIPSAAPPPPPPQDQPPPPRRPRPASSTTRTDTSTTTGQMRPEGSTSAQQTNGQSIFIPAPCLVYERPGVLLLRILASLGIGALGVHLYELKRYSDPHLTALSCVLIAIAVFICIRNGLSLIVRRPTLIIDRRGMELFGSGLLPWSEITRVWTFMQARVPWLAVATTPEHLQRVSAPRRALLEVRNIARGAEYVVRCSAFDLTPESLVRAVELQYRSGDLEAQPQPNAPTLPWMTWVNLLGIISAATPCIRLLLGFTVDTAALLGYQIIFATTQIAVTFGSMLAARRL